MNLIQNHENPNLLERGVGKNFTLEFFWLEIYGRLPYFHFHFLHVHKKVLGGGGSILILIYFSFHAI